jgi:curved DNA-binding protein CbpA
VTTDFYLILGVDPTATAEEIKERFRFLSHAYHPDKFATVPQREVAEKEFKRINEAYQVLSDPIQKASYDRERIKKATTESAPSRPSPPPRSPSNSSAASKVPEIENGGSVFLLWLSAAMMLVYAAVYRHSYTFHTLLRWVCCPILAYSAVSAHQSKRVAWTWIFGVLAVLYNPIFPVHLNRTTWIGVNWFTAALMLVAGIIFCRPSSNSSPP